MNDQPADVLTDAIDPLSRSPTRRMLRVPADTPELASAPLVIDTPGDYYLSCDIVMNGDVGIAVRASDVFLDLNGKPSAALRTSTATASASSSTRRATS